MSLHLREPNQPDSPDSPWHCAEEATVLTSRGSTSAKKIRKGVTNWRRHSGGAGAGAGGGSTGDGGDCGGDCGGGVCGI